MNKKNSLKLKIIMGIFAGISMIAIIYYLIEMYVLKTGPSYFTEHFLMSICLFCIGVIALLLTRVSTKRIAGENKGDSMMIVVGFLLIIISFINIFISYIS